MDILELIQGTLQPYWDALNNKISGLRTEVQTAKTEQDRLKAILNRDSNNLTNLSWDTVYDSTQNEVAGKIVAIGGGVTTDGAVFDVSQGSKDSAGNTKLPHAFYLMSAYTPTSGRIVVSNGTPVSIADLSVYITRTAFTTPTRYESKVSVVNFNATNADVYVKILKLLGTR